MRRADGPGGWRSEQEITDTVGLRRRIGECFELAALPGTPEADRKKALSFVVVGGGPTGMHSACPFMHAAAAEGSWPAAAHARMQLHAKAPLCGEDVPGGCHSGVRFPLRGEGMAMQAWSLQGRCATSCAATCRASTSTSCRTCRSAPAPPLCSCARAYPAFQDRLTVSMHGACCKRSASWVVAGLCMRAAAAGVMIPRLCGCGPARR